MFKKNNDEIIGNWQGILPVGKIESPIIFVIKNDDIGNFTVNLISPKQRKTIEANFIKYENKELQIDLNMIGGKFVGKYQPSSQKITGKWYQGDKTFNIILERINKVIEIKSPQEPHKPYPYVEEQVSYKNREADITLGGTLTYPRDKSPFPTTILISGSGALDRNETVFGHHPFLVLADYLTRKGIAVLRTDDRGVGESSGNYRESTNIDFANDVIAGINYLKSRKEIDSKKIGLIGHSEGGVIAPIVANSTHDIAFIVLMAGPGLPLEEILYRQAESIGRGENLSEDTIIKERSLQEKMFSIIKKEKNNALAKSKLEKLISEALKEMKDQNLPILSQSSIEAQIEYMLSPWFRDFLIYDPRIELRKLKCPVLVLNGEKDLQVTSEENLSAIKRALNVSGNEHYEVKELPNLNHLFQTARTGAISEYVNIEETISPIALRVIADWILERSRETSNVLHKLI